MNEIAAFWTKEQFLAYVLLYMAQSDMVQSEKEKELIQSKISEKSFLEMQEILEKDNDYRSIQKIASYVEAKKLTDEDLENLSNEIVALFYADSTFDTLEQNMLRGLRKILKD